MTTRQQAQELLAQLSEDKLQEIFAILKKLTSKECSDDELLTEQDAERQQRLKAFEDLKIAREKLIAMNIDWEAELKEALHEKYGV